MNGTITVILDTPGFERIEACHAISIRDWRKNGLDPLPANHDLALDIDSYRIAQEQRRDRERFIGFLSELLAQYITRQIEKQDPVNGYSRADYERMNGFQVGFSGLPDAAYIRSFLDNSEEGKAGDQGE